MSGYTWDLDKTDPMIVVVSYNGKQVLRLFLGEAMESAGRTRIMRHIKECDKTPWLRKWHDDPFEIIKNSK